MRGLIDMAEKIPQHNHCMMCMKAIPFDERLCSEECRLKYQSVMKKKRYLMLFMWFVIVAAIVLLMVLRV
jgi:predicted nucleic acid-binding Zn ribbon protein